MKNADIYHPSLAAALDYVERFAAEQRAVINTGFAAPDSWRDHFSVNYNIQRGGTARESFELLRYRGKETRKGLHVTLYRMESGFYELNCYIL